MNTVLFPASLLAVYRLASRDRTRPNLGYVQIAAYPTHIRANATDGHRAVMATFKRALPCPDEPIVYGYITRADAEALVKSKATAAWCADTITAGHVRVKVQLTPGESEYPAIDTVMPTQEIVSSPVWLDAEYLGDMAKVCKPMSGKGSDRIAVALMSCTDPLSPTMWRWQDSEYHVRFVIMPVRP